MSKADELHKKMGQARQAGFTPRQSVAIRPIPTPEAVQPPEELVALYAMIPKKDKRWLGHYKVDSGRELAYLVTEAVKLFREKIEQEEAL